MTWQLDLSLLILQYALGLYFAIAGWRKCFCSPTRGRIDALFRRLGLSKLQQNLVTYGQMLAGFAFLSGILVQLAALLMLPMMFGAVKLHVFPERKAATAGEHWTSLLSSLVCTAEVQMIAALFVLILLGESAWSPVRWFL